MDNKKEKVKDYIRQYYKKTKKVPSIKNTAGILGFKEREVWMVYRHLQSDGWLKRNYAIYKKNWQETNNKPKDSLVLKDNIMIPLIRILMGIIGAGATILSVYYTGKWLLEFLPVFLAYLLSSIMVLFSVISFETMIVFLKNEQYFPLIVFGILWVVVLLFSMMSTVAGQYNARINNEKKEISENVEVIHKKEEFKIYNKIEMETENDIGKKERRLESLVKRFEDLMTFEIPFKEEYEEGELEKYQTKKKQIDREIKGLKKDIDGLEHDISELRKKLDKVREEKLTFLEEESVEGVIEESTAEFASFYVWVSSIFNAETRFVEFWLSVFPAVFIDLVAPLAIAVGMFLRKKRRKNDSSGN